MTQRSNNLDPKTTIHVTPSWLQVTLADPVFTLQPNVVKFLCPLQERKKCPIHWDSYFFKSFLPLHTFWKYKNVQHFYKNWDWGTSALLLYRYSKQFKQIKNVHVYACHNFLSFLFLMIFFCPVLNVMLIFICQQSKLWSFQVSLCSPLTNYTLIHWHIIYGKHGCNTVKYFIFTDTLLRKLTIFMFFRKFLFVGVHFKPT